MLEEDNNRHSESKKEETPAILDCKKKETPTVLESKKEETTTVLESKKEETLTILESVESENLKSVLEQGLGLALTLRLLEMYLLSDP